MPQQNAEATDRRNKWFLLIVSGATLIMLAAAALRENVQAPWYRIRSAYTEILRQKATDQRGKAIAEQFEVRIVQNYLADLKTVDRCTTCHTGVDDPRMADQAQPYTTHPGSYLALHPPEKFGCTICHEGQGRATEKDDAHGSVPYWDHPMLARKYLHTACSKCHEASDLYGEHNVFAAIANGQKSSGIASPALGRRLVCRAGCLGCHVLDGKGGVLGPDITLEGDKTKHELDFSHFDKDEPRKVTYWLKKHFLDPGAVSPDTVMPAVELDDGEVDALISYLLSLKRRVAPVSHRVGESRPPLRPPDGRELYGLYCSACHGANGLATEVPDIMTPALNNADSLAVASADYYRAIVANGRSNTKMPAWKEGAGNLTRSEIDKLVGFLRSWEADGALVGDASARTGNPLYGRAYYQGLCASCHGVRGGGGVGNTLNSASFLAISSDRFLAQTIVEGRPGTAMPSWKHLSAQAVSDILAYIRTWEPGAPARGTVHASRAEGDPVLGRRVYQANCAPCHGRRGEGGIGLVLNSSDILRVVDDDFLYQTIVDGRPTTAMPSWRHLPEDQIGAVISFLRTWQPGTPVKLKPPARSGDYSLGEVLYNANCVRCHGQRASGGVGPQLANPVFLRSVSDTVLLRWISRGRVNTPMKGFLEGEEGVASLSQDNIMDIIAYIRHEGMRTDRLILRSGVGNPAQGHELYQGTCASCHGPDGEGASGPQLNNPSFLRAASDGFLLATMVTGRSGTPMRSMVSGQEGLGQISPSQLQDIVSHLRLWDYRRTWTRPRAVAEMSERAITAGREKFAVYCSGCHGPDGRGQQDAPDHFAPALHNPEFLEAASDGFLLATIARGRRGTPMRPFGRGSDGIASLTEEDINDIVSFIRTWHENRPRQTGKEGETSQ